MWHHQTHSIIPPKRSPQTRAVLISVWLDLASTPATPNQARDASASHNHRI
jgi:hypothetical protein